MPAGFIQNATYGTARVLLLAGVAGCESLEPCLKRGFPYLKTIQNGDGCWGGGSGTPSSIEQTALACEALSREPESDGEALRRGLDWLCRATAHGTKFPPSPIGFYFANLWYHEQLYPLIFTVAAFERSHGTADV